jgi:hypothetical protein
LEADKRVETAFYNFSRDSFPAKADVQAFAWILSEILFGAWCERSRPVGEVPSFASELIVRAQYTNSKAPESFASIWRLFKQKNFYIVEGVEIGEVFHFVNLIQLSERLTE